MQHIISVLVENKPRVLARVASLFARRGYNIESLAVGHTQDPDVSRITLVVRGDEDILEQITKQLYKLIEVIKVGDFTEISYVDRELSLIKVNAPSNLRGEIVQTAEIFRARIVDVSEKSLLIEVTGTSDKIDALKQLMKKYGIIEMTRTGKIALARGGQSL
ncbi:MAG TPA: acetolactate synthase small subunit [Atribacter sp.]|jgi:acetolactate synthase-1/3 small subunit|uniref:Acetolactate synthase small subunit n=1 Tax=Candidatus Atribacter allofermentans TaxID=1852833 RepID=A0A1V5T2P6_9BACT|nr:acetolactate synthase small subunit [Atribacter sp.]MDD3713446.1 acetolactate synthase small subunit [Atribacterota bacterium]OQA60988.1 MAG: Acetolactate synthase small subunit [Candidatus Atribacteria bacterium ADurb.Bin276]HAX97628.1 acetolactate synthase small subunit [Candidatus Atribacteria bacterium]MDI9593652.1 acetolactate synthase small subunit [Atribacterota bacterium]HCU22178.1 acetolactate synthase small subunit [Candidatus Atribacteria bacterium]